MDYQVQYTTHLKVWGPNRDGVDGKLGPKTATAAYKLLKAKGIINEMSLPGELPTHGRADGLGFGGRRLT